MATAPTLRMPADRRCSHAPRHRWEPAPEKDLDLGPAFRCVHCKLVRWAETSDAEPAPGGGDNGPDGAAL